MATVAPAGRGHTPFLETLIINKLQNAAWKRSQKKVSVSTPYLKRYLIINQLHFTPVAASRHLSRRLSCHVGRQDTILINRH